MDLTSKMRIALYCDPMMSMNGQVKAQIQLANAINADIITSGFNKNLQNWISVKTKIIDIGSYTAKINSSLNYFFEAPIRFFFLKNLNYDLNIYSGVSSIYASKKNYHNIWICYTPNRIMYDLRAWKLNSSSPFKKFLFGLHIRMFNSLDQKKVKNNFSKIISISNEVRKRVKTYYDKKSEVIYFGINTSKYYFEEFGDFFLCVSRLTQEKRVDLVAKVFTKMPHKKLIIVGAGPEENHIKKIIKNSTNIILYSNISEVKLLKLYAKCFAAIYIPINEDYGYSPIEAMASGKICIGANEGGCRETIINGKTGYLIDVSINNLMNIVNKLTIEKVRKMKKNSIKQASLFNENNFIHKWQKIVQNFNK